MDAIFNLTNKDYSGRYHLANDIEEHINILCPSIKREIKEKKIDPFVFSAIDYIDNDKDAQLFTQKVYPLEITKSLFYNKIEDLPILNKYNFLEFILDEVVWKENTGSIQVPTIKMTPKSFAKRNLSSTFDFYTSILNLSEKEINNLKSIWKNSIKIS